MDLHMSKKIFIKEHEGHLNEAQIKSYNLLETTIVNQYELQKEEICENLCEIQVEGYLEDSNDPNMKNQRKSSLSCHSMSPKPKIKFKNDEVEVSSIKFQSDIWPINAHEQKENFFKLGLSPKFKLKGSISGIEKMVNHQNGKIKFNYFYEAKRILDFALRKYKTLDKFVQYAFGKAISLEEAKAKVTKYLSDNGLENCVEVIWTKHLICSAQMCTTTAKGKLRERQYTLLIKNNHENTFIREHGIECLLNHEIGTHYLRSYNESLEVWNRNRLKYDLVPLKSHEGMKTEEGLACVHTILDAKIRFLCMPALLYYGSCMAEYLSFKQLFEHLIRYVKNPEQRWKHCMRIKRILKSTSDMGGYGKDQRYFEGAVEILRNIDKIDFKTLMSGKIVWTDIPKVKQIQKRSGLKYPHFMVDYPEYIKNLKEIATLNGLIHTPDFKFTPRSRKDTIQYLGLSEEHILKVRKAHKTLAGGDSENNVAKLCGCVLFSGIKSDVNLDSNENNKLAKKRQIPIIFELEMKKPIIQ